MKKKLLVLLFSILAVVALACGLIACGDSKDIGDTNDLNYMKVGDEYVVTGIGNYKGSDLVIPSKYNGLPVTAVDDTAFYMCKTITSVTIEEGVTEIGNHAFYFCKYIEEVTIPSTVTEIGRYAFYSCTSLKNIDIPDSVTSIGNYAFYNCLFLTDATIGTNVETIGSYAFYNCPSLTSIIIPGAETSVGTYAFGVCTSLVTAVIGDGVTSLNGSVFYGCTSLTSVTIGESVSKMGSSVFSGCTALEEIHYNAVAMDDFSSGQQVFYQAGQNTDGATLIIGSSVTKIPAYIFSANPHNVTTVVFEDESECVYIGASAFSYHVKEVYYSGSESDWAKISIGSSNLSSATIYYYSNSEPTTDGDFWHYVNGEIVVWKKED